MVVAAALYHGVAGAVGVTPENHAGVILIFIQHTEIKGNVFLHAVNFQELVDLLQAFDRCQGLLIVRQALRPVQHLAAAEHLRKGDESLFQLLIERKAFEKLLDSEEVFHRNEGTDLCLVLLRKTGLLHQALEKTYMAHTHLKLLKTGFFEKLHAHGNELGIRLGTLIS